jgi:lipopolysaccharide/colanic/teichoic acid biosynthesis glycosyltransferase
VVPRGVTTGAKADPGGSPTLRHRLKVRFDMSSDQLSVSNSTHVRDDIGAMVGISPRIRRVFEFAAAATGVILLAPIFLATAIAIKLNSHGPIFITEPELGPDNRIIYVFKFRLTTTRAKRGVWQRPNWTGLVLDGTGVGHLPRLFNVLRGEMSLADLLRTIGRDGVFLP